MYVCMYHAEAAGGHTYIHTYTRDPGRPPWRLKCAEEQGEEEGDTRPAGCYVPARALGLQYCLDRRLRVWRQRSTILDGTGMGIMIELASVCHLGKFM